ncbi:CPBP family intramembrane glutamic endopeptidase [Holdemania massiliensis]|uniref:CPBP family intramembrane glutamic endopeptidase n=1 Tax=Holdemania massiliensis TaxID=1468449 RepID=UPI003521AE56
MSERVVQTVTPRQLRWEFNGIGLTFLVVFALAAGVIFGYQWLTPILEPYYQTVDRQAAEMGIRIVVTLVVMLLPFQVYAALKKIKTGRFFGACQGEWREILELILIGLALNLLLTFIVGILALVLSWSNIQFASSEMIVQGKLPAVILSVVQAVLIFPLCEEFIFRGVCLRSFGRMGNYFAIFASSLLFSLMHGNLISILPSFFLGVFLAVVTMRFNSILPALIIHIAINLQTVALQCVPVQYSWIIGLSCILIYALALAALIRNRHQRIIIRREANPWVLIQQFFLSWAMVITLILYGVLNVLTIKL